MVERRLPEVGPPSGRVLGRGLLVLPISEARRRRNRGEITKKGYVLEGFSSRRIYRRMGAARGPPGVEAPPGAASPWGAPPGRLGPWWWPTGPTQVLPEGSFTLIFYLIFPEFLEHILYGGKLKQKNSRKHELALWCTELIG